MNRSKSVSLWLWLATCSFAISGCLTTYDPGEEEFVTGCDPAAAEQCNGVDDNCNDQVDEGCDDDADGYCDASMTVGGSATCQAGDCDDTSAAVHPGAAEKCSGVDESCNDEVDEDCDSDGDGYCEAGKEIVYSSSGALPAVCSMGIDDCDDEDAALTSPRWYLDGDGDGAGDDATVDETCTPASGYVATGGDCDDTDPERTPGASEVCDGKDNDCNDEVDDAASDATTFYADSDGDTYGDAQSAVEACAAPSGYVEDATDCDDTLADAYPGAPELCDDVLNDCAAGAADAGCNDDGDAYCDEAMTTVGTPAVCTGGGGDCDDADGAVSPGAAEVCSPFDQNCDGLPGDLSLETIVARAVTASGVGEDLALGDGVLGVVWAEEGEATRVGKFARVGVNNLTVIDTQTLTMQQRAVYDVGVAWDATSSSWGVAYNALDQAAGTWVVGLLRLDASGQVIADEVLDSDTGQTQVQVLSAGQYFGVIYDKGQSSDRDVWYAPYQISNDTPRAPNIVVQDRSVVSGSFAYLPSSQAIYMVWSSSGGNFFGGAVAAASGSTNTSFTDRALPGTSPTDATVHVANDRLFVTFRGAPASGTGSLKLKVVELQPWMAVGAATELADMTSTNDRALVYDGSDFVVLFPATDTTTSPSRAVMQFRRFNTTWGQLADRFTDATHINSNASQTLPLVTDGTYYYFLDQSTDNGFFRLYSLYETGQERSNREPVSAATYTSPINAEPYWRRFLYDAANDRFTLVQSDPVDTSQVQVLTLGRDGMVSAPVAVGPFPTGCPSSVNDMAHLDDTLVCMTQGWDEATCTQSLTFHALDLASNSWTEIESASWPARGGSCEQGWLFDYRLVAHLGTGVATLFGDNNNGVWLRVLDGANGTTEYSIFANDPADAYEFASPYNLQMLALEDGRLAVVVSYELYDIDTNDRRMGVQLTLVDPTTGAAAPVTVESVDFPSGVGGFIEAPWAGPFGDQLALTVRRYLDNGGTSSRSLALFLVDPTTGASTEALLGSSTSSSGDFSVGRPAVVGDRLMIPFIEYDWNAGLRDAHLASADATGTISTRLIGEKVDSIYGVAASGDVGYYAVFMNKPVGGEVTVVDASGATITSGQMAFSTVDSLFVDHFVYSGTEFLALVQSGQRVFLVDGTCN